MGSHQKSGAGCSDLVTYIAIVSLLFSCLLTWAFGNSSIIYPSYDMPFVWLYTVCCVSTCITLFALIFITGRESHGKDKLELNGDNPIGIKEVPANLDSEGEHIN